MSTPLRVLDAPNTGPQLAGLSYYKMILACSKKAAITQAIYAGDLIRVPQKIPARYKIGSIYHKLQEWYLPKTPAFECANVATPIGTDDRSRKLAERVFRAYRTKYPADFWGRPLAVEATIPDPTDDKAAEAVSRAVGAWPLPYRAKPDRVIKLTKRQADRIRQTEKIAVKPGVYILDFKTARTITPALLEFYRQSLQTILYQLAHNATATEAKQAQGAIIHIASKESPTKFATVLQPKAGGLQKKQARLFFEAVKAAMSEGWQRRARPDQCVTPWESCEFLGNLCPGV